MAATAEEQFGIEDGVGEMVAAAEAAAAEAAAAAAEEAAKSAAPAIGLFGLGTLSVGRKAAAEAPKVRYCAVFGSEKVPKGAKRCRPAQA